MKKPAAQLERPLTSHLTHFRLLGVVEGRLLGLDADEPGYDIF